MERPTKRVKLLSDSEESEDEGEKSAGFKVNEDFAKRFEHNKKREEKQRLEEKYQDSHRQSTRSTGQNGTADESDEDDSESDDSEDDEGDLATRNVDQEIFATLEAIKKKDPRVYDKSVKFYADFEADEDGVEKQSNKEKPMYLHDYHRQNLLAGHVGEEAEDEEPVVVRTYKEDQDGARTELLRAAHAATNGTTSNGIDGLEEDDDLVEVAPRPIAAARETSHNIRSITDEDIAHADHDPETYLSNFMAARAWVPNATSRFTALDSDDSEDERRAEKFEEAYNMRFEDPATANETLKSFARDVGKYGVRRDQLTTRQRARERQRENKEAAKREREEDRARLRKLKIEEAEEKVRRIKDAAGLRGKELNVDDWRDIIEADFDDDQWDKEMQKRFGESYYAGEEDGGSDEEEEDGTTAAKRSRLHKPKWNDDIDINDLVPDFEKEEQEKARATFTLSSDDEAGVALVPPEQDLDTSKANEDQDEEEHQTRPRKKSKKDRAKEKSDLKRAARLERRAIEDIVDTTLPFSDPALTPSSSTLKATPSSAAKVPGFQYRSTSPTSFGLTARDILYADDSQLNAYAGLKKFATFREEEKKRKDRKRYSKKARLREWRKETFGDVEGPKERGERAVAGEASGERSGERMGAGESEKSGGKKKKRGRKAKAE